MRDTTLMLDSEWESAYAALPDYAREKMRQDADRNQIKLRYFDPADYADIPAPEPTPFEKQAAANKAAAEAKHRRILETPIAIPEMPTQAEINRQAERLGVSAEGLRQARLEQIEATKIAETERVKELKTQNNKDKIEANTAKIAELTEAKNGPGLVLLSNDKTLTDDQQEAIRESVEVVWPDAVDLVA